MPTIGEVLPGYEVPVWYGLVVPAATPKAVVSRLNAEMKIALENPSVRERLGNQGIEVEYTTVDEFAKLIREDAARWAKLVKDAGIVLE